MTMIGKYLLNILISVDQFVNTVFGGDPDETISSRFGKRQDCDFCQHICRLLSHFDKGHCKKSIEEDEGKDEVI